MSRLSGDLQILLDRVSVIILSYSLSVLSDVLTMPLTFTPTYSVLI